MNSHFVSIYVSTYKLKTIYCHDNFYFVQYAGTKRIAVRFQIKTIKIVHTLRFGLNEKKQKSTPMRNPFHTGKIT